MHGSLDITSVLDTKRVIAGMHLGKGGGNNSGRVHAQVGSNVASHSNACTSIDPGQHLSQQCPDAVNLSCLPQQSRNN